MVAAQAAQSNEWEEHIFNPGNRSVAGMGSTSTLTHEAEGRSIVGERPPPPTTLESVLKYPSSLNKRTKWHEVIRDTAGLKIDSPLTDRAVLHDLCIALLVYSLSSCGKGSAQDLEKKRG